MYLIDKLGRKPLLLIGTAGIVVSMCLTSYGFSQATYNLSEESVTTLIKDEDTNEDKFDKTLLANVIGVTYDNDIDYKNALKTSLPSDVYKKMEGAFIQVGTNMNPILVLIGILGFVASFAISLGPVMWVLFSELFPNNIRGLAISFVGVINSGVSFLIQFLFPWELANLGNALTYLIFGIVGAIGFVLIYKMLPETKGKSLEEIERELVR